MSLPAYNTSVITAVARAQLGISAPKFLIGGKGGSGGTTYSINKKTNSYTFSLWRSKVFVIDADFNIKAIYLTLTGEVGAYHTITPVIGLDDGATIVEGTIINNTNYVNSERYIVLTQSNFTGNIHGEKNFYLELRFSGAALIGVSLPIRVEIETEI